MIKIKCKVCKKEILIFKSRLGRKKYCSKKCQNIEKKKSFIGNKIALGNTPWNKDKKTGIVPKSAFKKGHISWLKGTSIENYGYQGIHSYINRKLGQPKYCEHCKRTDKKCYDWANKDHKYSKNLKNWMRLCRSCHLKYDYKNNGFKQQQGY
jgi:hypothetical protein